MAITLGMNYKRRHQSKINSDKRSNIRRQRGIFNKKMNHVDPTVAAKKERRNQKKLNKKIEKKQKKLSRRIQRENKIEEEE